MAKRACRECEKVIGHHEESFYHYGHFICKECNTKLETHFQDPGIIDDETEIQTADQPTEQDSDVKHQAPPAENQAAADLAQPIQAEIPVVEESIDQKRDVKYQSLPAEDRAVDALLQAV